MVDHFFRRDSDNQHIKEAFTSILPRKIRGSLTHIPCQRFLVENDKKVIEKNV